MHARAANVSVLGAIALAAFALGGCFETEGLSGGAPGASGAAASSSPAPHYCAAHRDHTFCEDFDEAPLADEQWDDLVQQGGPLLLAPQGATPARTLVATVVAGRADSASTFVAKAVGRFSHLSIETDVRVERGDDLATVNLLFLAFSSAGNVASSWTNLAHVRGHVVAGVGRQFEDGTWEGTSSPVDADLSAFHRVAIDVLRGAAGATVTVSVDGRAVAHLDGPPLDGDSWLWIGPTDARDLGGDWRMHVDNVVLDVDR